MINDNGQDTQIAAAVALIQTQVSPVMQVSIAFGGDNHADVGLTKKAEQTVTGVQAISNLLSQLEAKGLQDKVTIVNLSVFGAHSHKKVRGAATTTLIIMS